MMNIFNVILLSAACLGWDAATAQPYPVMTQPRSKAMSSAVTAMHVWNDTAGVSEGHWDQGESIVWKGLQGLWLNTGDGQYFTYIQQRADRLIDKDGRILFHTDEQEADGAALNADGAAHNADGAVCKSNEAVFGNILLMLYRVTNLERYFRAAGQLRQLLKDRAGSGDVLMVQSFFADYASLFHEEDHFDDIARKFAATGEPAQVVPLGWYGLALVDVLGYFPADHPGRSILRESLKKLVVTIQKVQDKKTGVWSDASAGFMFIYILARAVREGYLPPDLAASVLLTARQGYGATLLKLPQMGGDATGTGIFLLACNEMDQVATGMAGKGKTVVLDYYFNNERHKDITGASVRFHYTWEDCANSGFSQWGQLFRQYGMHTDSLVTAPTAASLAKASAYIIVDPDDEREVPAPHYPTPNDMECIYDWVKGGGVLVLMSNDSANSEFTHFNKLAERFGIHFNWDCYHKVTGNKFDMGAFFLPPGDAIFATTKKIYIKELSTLRLSGPARPSFIDHDRVIMAIAKIGKGAVFAVGDPWFYNEYTDGRKLPADFENYNAARDLVQWIIVQSKQHH
jgi:unsaturated rhamnogalacturonyl hydrolase